MAYTFDELAIFFAGGPSPRAHITQAITQEDGRTSYGNGYFETYDLATQTFSGQITQIFNDRIDPHGPGASDDQPFAVGSHDIVGVKIRRMGSKNYKAEFTLKSWGNALQTVNLTKANQAKMLIGWGATIGHGTGQALYAVSFNSASYSPG
jgi:hypothetical protein